MKQDINQKGQTISQKDQTISQKGQTISREGQTISPKGQTISQEGQENDHFFASPSATLPVRGYWDIHNHSLPRLDDGSESIEETMAMLEEAYRQGIRNLIFTPHYREDMFEAPELPRAEAFAKIKELAHKAHPDMALFLGCELHMHPEQGERMEQDIFRMPGKRVVLAEFSHRDNFKSIDRIVKRILNQGFRCVIAHAERYELSLDDIRELSDMKGVYIQINADSFLGKMGFFKKQFVKKLLKEELVDLIGSDAHNMTDRTMHMGECIQMISKKYGEDVADIIFEENPKRIFAQSPKGQ